MMESEREKDEDFRKYAWDYFAMHASQRLLGVQFFITLATAIVGGYFVFISEGGQKWGAALGILLVVLAFVFYKLDARTRALIKNAENALSYLDKLRHTAIGQSQEPHPLQLIDRDDYLFSQNRGGGIFRATYSYTRCFNIVFILFAILGFAITAHAIFYSPSLENSRINQRISIQVDKSNPVNHASVGQKRGDYVDR